MRPSIVVINCKATTLNELVEFGAITLSPTGFFETAKFSTLIKPTKNPATTSPDCSITPAMLKKTQHLPDFEEVADEIYRTLHGKIWVGHGVIYAYNQIQEAFRAMGGEAQCPQYRYLVDTNILLSHDATFKNAVPDCNVEGLESLADFFGFQHTGRALEDARLTLEIFRTYSTICTLERCFQDTMPAAQHPYYHGFPAGGQHYGFDPMMQSGYPYYPTGYNQPMHQPSQAEQAMANKATPPAPVAGESPKAKEQKDGAAGSQEAKTRQPEHGSPPASAVATAAAAPTTAQAQAQAQDVGQQQRLGTITTEPSRASIVPPNTASSGVAPKEESKPEEKAPSRPASPAKLSYAALLRAKKEKQANKQPVAGKAQKRSLSHTPKAVERSPPAASAPNAAPPPVAAAAAPSGANNNNAAAKSPPQPKTNHVVASKESPAEKGASAEKTEAGAPVAGTPQQQQEPQTQQKKQGEEEEAAKPKTDGWVVAGSRGMQKRKDRHQRRSKEYKVKKLTEAINKQTRVWVLLKSKGGMQNHPKSVLPLQWRRQQNTVVVQAASNNINKPDSTPLKPFFVKVENIIELREQAWQVGGVKPNNST